ncbi:MAG: NAD(P)H-binding protein [Propionibacteriaceae bacterium]
MTANSRAPLLVAGGTGTLGRAVLARLDRDGTDYRVLSRKPGPGHVVADLLNSDGLDVALRDVTTVINCATSPRHDAQAADHLLQAARAEGVNHLVHVSIVGIDRVPLGYYREKLAVESLVAASGVPHTVLRATQFHDLLATMFATLSRSPVMPLPSAPFQPIDVRDVADRLVALVAAGPQGRVDDLGGPEVRDVTELARAWLAAHHRSRVVLPLRLPGKLARAYRNGWHCTPQHAEGVITFDDYLQARTTAVAS